MKLKQKQTDSIVKKIKDRWALILFGGVIFSFFVVIIKGEIKNYFLNNNSVNEVAIIVNEQNFWGNNSRIFSYSYEFVVNDKKYRADSRDNNLKVGDSVNIEYVPFYPNFSRIRKKKNDKND